MPRNVRPAIAELAFSQIREISRLGMGREDTIALWFGEGDAPTPLFIAAAARALDEGRTSMPRTAASPGCASVWPRTCPGSTASGSMPIASP